MIAGGLRTVPISVKPLPLRSERVCGTCSLCCKLVGIEALAKAPGEWCAHCLPGKGCAIYDRRPQECHDFSCAWLETRELGEEWRPARSRIVLYQTDGGARLIAHVDPGSPNAWRQRPYYQALKLWARQRMPRNQQVVVRIENRIIAILPDRDVDLGQLAPGDLVFIGRVSTPRGAEYVARKVPPRESPGALAGPIREPVGGA